MQINFTYITDTLQQSDECFNLLICGLESSEIVCFNRFIRKIKCTKNKSLAL